MAQAKEGCGGFDHASPKPSAVPEEHHGYGDSPTASTEPAFLRLGAKNENHCSHANSRARRASTAYTDFSDAFLSANLMGSPSRKRTVTTSIVLHTILIGVPLLLSAWFTDTLDLRTYTQTLLVAPPPAAAAPSPPPTIVAAPKQARRVFTSQGKLFMPTAIPRQVAMVKEAPLPPEPEGAGVFGGVPGGVTGGVIGGMLDAIRAPEAPPPPPRASAEGPRAPLPVGGNVQPPRIIYRVNPDYPLLAHQAGIQGEVIISAVIDSQGNVVDMKVVSGPPLSIQRRNESAWAVEV